MYETRRQRLEKLRGQLQQERASFEPTWKQLSDFILPRRSRWFTQDRNRGDRRQSKIIDSTTSRAMRTLASGMMAGITSPARPWFKLATPYRELNEIWSVKNWLEETREILSNILLRSGIYDSLPELYQDLGTFATSPMLVEPSARTVVRTEVFPVGSYYIAQDREGRVNVFMRQFQMTVRQVVDDFGRSSDPNAPADAIDWSNISSLVQQLWMDGQTEAWVEVVHFVLPNDEYNPNKKLSRYKKYLSCYYERGVSSMDSTAAGASYAAETEKSAKYLREAGFDYFPVLCPRWDRTGEDVYGTNSPGWEALGTTKQLQHNHRRKAQAIDKKVNPPMNAPGSMRNSKLSILPGEVNFIEGRGGDSRFEPALQIQIEIAELLEDIQDERREIREICFTDMFALFTDDQRAQPPTAEEIRAKQQEKLLRLGPVLERLNTDLLDPLIDLVFYYAMERGLIAPPPDELSGVQIKVEYISIMADAQKAAGLGSLNGFASAVGQVAAFDPSVLDNVNRDELVRIYADRYGVPPKVLMPADQVAAIRAQRAQAQAAQQQVEMVQKGAGAAKDLASADLSKDSALSRLLDLANAGRLTAKVA